MKLKKVLATLLSAALLTTCFAGCGGSKDASSGNASAGDDENKLVIYCPHPLSFINPLVEEFEKESGRHRRAPQTRRIRKSESTRRYFLGRLPLHDEAEGQPLRAVQIGE